MKRARLSLIVLAAGLAGVAAACGPHERRVNDPVLSSTAIAGSVEPADGGTHAPRVDAATAEGAGVTDAGQAALAAPGELLELGWLPDGTRVVVDGRWLLEPARGRYVAISCRPGSGRAMCPTNAMVFSPDGTRALVVDDARIAVGPVAGPLGPGVAISRWVRARGSRAALDLVNVGFWLTAGVVFVQQFDRRGELTPECRLYDADARRWRRPAGGCLSPDFGYLARVDVGPGSLLALHSSAEGHYALSIVRYGTETGQADTGAPSITLEGASAVRVRFAPDASHVDLISPCRLEGTRPPPCGDFDSEPAWKLYSLPAATGSLRLRRTDLPPGSVLDPTAERFAWPKDRAVCVGEPREPAPKCFPLPR